MSKADLSARPRKPVKRPFYGWWVVLAAVFIGIYSGGTVIYGVTVFINPVIGAFGWSYLQVSSAIALTGAFIGVLAPFVGRFVDRFGSRRMLWISASIVGLGYVLMSLTESLGWFYLANAVISIGATGCGSIVLQAPMAHWFRRRAGFAMGVTSAGVGMGGLMLPVIAWLVSGYGWRTASVILGAGTIVFISSLATLIRQKPEDYGYYPDGDQPSADFVAAARRRPRPPASGMNARAAMRTGSFWLLAVAFSIYFLGLNAVVILIMPYLENVHLEPSAAALVATFLPIASIAGRIGYGWLGDRIRRKIVLAITFAMQACGLVVFLFAPALWSLVLFAIIYGTGFGGSIALGPAMTREYFGRSSFASIQGWMIAATTLSGVIGPIMAGWIFDTWHSYGPAWIIFAAANALGIIAILLLKSAEPTS